jgi:predicted PurR-regulated permease PerM
MSKSPITIALQLPAWTSDPVFLLLTVLTSLALGGVVYVVGKHRNVDGALVLGVLVAVVALIDPLSGALGILFSLVYVYVQSR